MECECDHTGDEEQEHRKQFKISTEDCTTASFLFILTRKNALNDELVSTPVPETDHSRTDEGTEPGILCVAVVADEVGHCVAVFIHFNS